MKVLFRFSGLALLLYALPAMIAAEQVLRRGGIGDPESLDPQRLGSPTEGTIMTDLFTGLLALGPAGDIVLGCAENWSVDESATTYAFVLRENLRWSDGTPMSADDFLYGIRRTFDPATGSRAASFLYSIVNAQAVNRGELPVTELGVRAIDERVLEVRLQAPTPYFSEMVAVNWKPAPRHAIEEHGVDWIRPGNHVGNGPFKLVEWIPNQYVKLVKNEYFHEADSVKLDAVIHYPAEDLSTSLRRFRAGEFDIATAFPNPQLGWVKENLPDALHITPTIQVEALVFNTQRPPFDDVRVRRALSMAVDRERIVDKILRGGELPAYGMVPPAAGNYPDRARAEFAELDYEQRLERAAELLSAAGYRPDAPLRFELRINASDSRKQVALAAASMWKRIGADAQLLSSEDKARLRDMYTGNYQAALSLRIVGASDAYVFLQPYHSESGFNHPRYSSSAYDRLLEQASATADIHVRARILKQAEERLLADHPIAPLYVYASKKLVSPRVRGWVDNPKSINPARYLSLAAD